MILNLSPSLLDYNPSVFHLSSTKVVYKKQLSIQSGSFPESTPVLWARIPGPMFIPNSGSIIDVLLEFCKTFRNSF